MKAFWKRSKGKLNICLFGLISVLLLAGFGYKAILKNAPDPFIDLRAGTKMAVSNAEKVKAESEPTQTPKPETLPTSQIEVRVTGSDFFVDGKVIKRLSDLSAILKDDSAKNKSVVLIDDYANYLMYRNVEKRIEAAGVSYVKREEK